MVTTKHEKRYLARGFIDGLLASLGVIIGACTAISTTTDAATQSLSPQELEVV